MYNEDIKSYNVLKFMSGLVFFVNYNILLAKGEVDESIKAKYFFFMKCVNDLDCFKNYEEGVVYVKENDMFILFDFIGYGCVNCCKIEEYIWVEDVVKDKLE